MESTLLLYHPEALFYKNVIKDIVTRTSEGGVMSADAPTWEKAEQTEAVVMAVTKAAAAGPVLDDFALLGEPPILPSLCCGSIQIFPTENAGELERYGCCRYIGRG